MTTVTTTTKTKKEIAQEKIAIDKARANELILLLEKKSDKFNVLKAEAAEEMNPLITQFDEKAKPIKEKYEPKFKKLDEEIEVIEKELLEIGKRQRKKLFGVDGNWFFENGYYLHVKKITIEKLGKAFDFNKFIKKFNDYVDVSFKIKELKALMQDEEKRKKSGIEKFDFALTTREEIEIKIKKQKADEQQEKTAAV
jgi:hypothetical protein